MGLLYRLVLTSFAVLCIQFSNGDLIVDINSGKIAGKEVESIFPQEKYYSFLGIPYAQPPLKELRFMPPKPHEGWEDVLDCTEERSVCAQFFLPVRHVKERGFTGDEDCLFLSVHTPKLPKNDQPNLPVMVFLINDQFRLSYNVTKDYSPDFFMKEDVIVVTVNHRLGALGFLCFEDEVLPGNNGLRDVLLALQWIQENIKQFGGDPNNVTLMGNQGGAVAADILLHSKKSKGLFHRAILQSGTSWNSVFLYSKGQVRAKELAEELNIDAPSSSTLLRFLKRITADEITQAELKCVHADEGRSIQRGIPPFSPLIEHEHEDAVITKLPEDTIRELDIPLMIGYNSREVLDVSERYLAKPQYLTFLDRDFMFMFPIRVPYRFKVIDQVYKTAIQEIKDFYLEEGYIKIKKPSEFMNYMNDAFHIYPVDYTVRQYANDSLSSPIYYYMFDYSGDWNVRKKQNLEKAMNLDGTWGASATDELCYLFVCNKYRKLYEKALNDEESEEMKVLKNMVRLWTNFAKTSNPTPSNEGFVWTPVTPENKECLLINEELEMKTNLHSDSIQFWDEFLEKYRRKAVDGVVKDIRDEL